MKADLSRVFQGSQLYRAIWRWHFYIGLLVMPFLLLLCLSGLLMLASKPVDEWRDRELTTLVPAGTPLPASTLLSTVRQHYPEATVELYIPPWQSTESARFSLTQPEYDSDQQTITVYVNPYSGDILGSRDPADTLYEKVKVFHSTLLLSDIGNILVEGAAGLGILMILSGLYLSWSRYSRDRSAGPGGLRRRWRYWHKLSGWIVALPLLFFLLSGLAWTSVWGEKLVQPWGSLPSTSFEGQLSNQTYESLNRQGIHQVPWALEQTPMPRSASSIQRLGLDDVGIIAEQHGFRGYRVHLPQGEGSAWTLSATTMAGDLNNPLAERILHLDPANGRPLAEITFGDYPAMGMAMAASIPLHQGDLGVWNLLLNAAIILFILLLMATGTILWWQRRAPAKYSLQAPPANPATSKVVIGIMLIVALCFPVSAALLTLVIIIDLLISTRIRVLQPR